MATASALAAVAGIEVAKLAVKTALGSLVNLAKYEWCLQKTVKDGLASLKAELNFMEACIENFSSGPQGEVNPVDKLWLAEVNELSYTIKTGLQSFTSSFESIKGNFLSAPNKLLINHQIASFIKGIMIKVKEVSERRGRYDYSASKTSFAHKVDPRIFALYEKKSDLVGLAGATDELTKMLSTCDHVSIVGMGGMGKTTLAQAVYGKLQMKGEFDCCAFVTVGQNASGKKVLKDILYELEIEINGAELNEMQLINKLQKSLVGKRCLFFIDDIWDNEAVKFIKCALVDNPESRIITTTRKLEVAKQFGGVYMMKLLSDTNSKELLHAKIFGAEAKSHDTEFARLSDRILSKCGGVPIAIITIAGLLAKKPRDEWSKVYDSIGFAEQEKEDVVKRIRMILSFSYYDLPCHLQKCFLYLSLFPKGHWIEKNMLIWRWVAEGLVPGCNEQRVELFELGETYFNELIDRSMIQRAVSPRDLGQGGCRIHDMMLDLIRDLSSSDKENFSTVLDGKQESTSQALPIHRLAIHGNGPDETQNNIPTPTPQKNPNTSLKVGTVQSFYASSCPGSSLPRFSNLALMRVMDLEYCDLSVGDHKLKHLSKSRELAYIGLLGTPVAKIPKKIGRLKLLLTLDVTGTGMKELPLFVCELKKLRCLRAGKGTKMLGRVGELTSLEELWLHSADKSPDFAAELRKLTQLRVLVVHFDEIVEGMQEELVESLSVLKKLQVLQVWFDTDRKACLPCWEESVPFPKLRQLLLFGVIQLRLMPWIHCECIPELTKLLLEVEVLEAQDLEILGQMPSLLSLYLHSEDGNRLSYTASKDEFKVLEYLYTNIELVCGDGALPRIQELEVAGIRVGTDVGLRGNNMPLLERASYHLDCKDCGPEEVRKAEETLKEASEAHPNHPTVSIKRFNNLLLEMHHLLIESLSEFWKAFNAHVSGAGGEVQTNINSLFLNLLIPAIPDLILEAAARTRAVGGPPTLAVGDANTDSPSSPSSTSPVIKISTDSGYRQLLDSMLLLAGLDPAVISNKMNADRSLLASKIARMLRASAQDIISQYEQNAGFLGSVGVTPSSHMGIMILRTSAMLQAANCTDGAQARNDQIDEINAEIVLAAFDRSVASDALTDGVDPADLRSLLENAMQNPEVVECFKSMARNAGGPQFGSDFSKVMKLIMADDVLSSKAQKTDVPAECGKGADSDSNLAATQPAENSGAGLRHDSPPEVTADSVLSFLNTPVGAALSSETAARLGMSQVAFRKLLEKHLQKPEMIASWDSALRSGDFSGMVQQMAPDIVDHFIGQYLPMPSSSPGYAGGGGQADQSGMLSGLLGNLAVGADPTGQLASMEAAASSTASVAPGSSQDCENSMILKELLPAVELIQAAGASSGQPSSTQQPDIGGTEEGGAE